MNYWPLLSVIAESPLLPAVYAAEVRNMYRRPCSEGAYYACMNVARNTAPIDTGLLIIESVDAPCRRMYAEYPDFAQWAKLERGGVIQDVNGRMYVIVDGLH